MIICIFSSLAQSRCSSSSIARNKQSRGERIMARNKCALDILFSSNHNIHKSSFHPCFWASDPLIERFKQNPSIKGSEAQKQWPIELLWTLWFDEKSISSAHIYRLKKLTKRLANLFWRDESSNINSLKCHLKLPEETAFYFGLFGLWSEQRDILQVLQIVHINFSVYDTELHAALPATAIIH